MLKRPSGRLQQLAIVLLLAGGIGNLIDRTFHGGLVIDFLNVGIGPLRTGIFNVADMAIMAGFGLLILYSVGFRDGQSGDMTLSQRVKRNPVRYRVPADSFKIRLRRDHDERCCS